jgi:8-oxo-dGTP diphosphatase
MANIQQSMKNKKHIEIIARGVFVDDGKVLLCRARKALNVYLPGGHVETGESAREALCREIEEELGCVAVAGRFLGAAENCFVQKGERHCEINLVFEMRVKGLHAGMVPISCEDYIEFRWVSMSRIQGSGLKPAFLRRVLPSWLETVNSARCWLTNME